MDQPSEFTNGDEFYHWIHTMMGLKEPYCEHQGGGAWVAYDGDKLIAIYNESSGAADWGPFED